MITKPNNYDQIKAAGGFERLPAGGYVIEIKKAEIKTSVSGYEYLDLTIEISEGIFAGYFMDEYNAQQFEPKRYKGHFRQGTPKDDQSSSYFKAMITAIEESNPGYTWDWNEQSLVGKTAGCLMRSEEWEYNGRSGMRTAPFRLTAADNIRSGNYLVPQPKYLSQNQDNGSQQQPQAVTFEEVRDEDIPF